MALVDLIKDPNPAIQIEAAETAGKLQIADAVPTLVEVLEHQNDEVALRAAAALGRMGNRQGLPTVLQLLRLDHKNTRLAALALGLIVGQRFRLNNLGVKQARIYAKKYRLHKQT
jgi:HEAT repeat protein